MSNLIQKQVINTHTISVRNTVYTSKHYKHGDGAKI